MPRRGCEWKRGGPGAHVRPMDPEVGRVGTLLAREDPGHWDAEATGLMLGRETSVAVGVAKRGVTTP